MNLKSNMLKIGVVIALIFILLPVIAAEDVDNSVYAENAGQSDVSVVQSSDDSSNILTATSDDDVTDDDIEGDATEGESADLEVAILPSDDKVKVGDVVTFAVVVLNNGPDTATNVIVNDFTLGSGLFLAAMPSQGSYDYSEGEWDVGDLDAGEYAVLYLIYQILDDGGLLLFAEASSDTPDPDLENNFALALVEVEDDGNGSEIKEPSSTMPATGNPVALAILALMSIVGVSLKRKF